MKAEIENERVRLMATKGLAEGERNLAQKELEEREDELKQAQEQQQELEKKLNELNSKVGPFLPSFHPSSPTSILYLLLFPSLSGFDVNFVGD